VAHQLLEAPCIMKVTAAVLFLSSLVGCASQSGSDDGYQGGGKADGSTRKVLVTIGDCSSERTDGYKLTNVIMDSAIDSLDVDVSYTGGCAEHTYKVCWDGMFLESTVVQAQLKLFHDANDDECEAPMSESISIDLAPIAAAYKEMYQTHTGDILLGLDNFSDKYSFASLSATQLEATFSLTSVSATYTSESDSAPTWLSASAPATITGTSVATAFRTAMALPTDRVFEVSTGQTVKDRLADWAEYSATDEKTFIDSAKAWGRIKNLFEENLTELTFVRFGPKDSSGKLAVDAGLYHLVIVGKTFDGKMVGFFVTSVET
jgi:hypothetical protein